MPLGTNITERSNLKMSSTGDDKIMLAHGGGGQLTDSLIRQNILPHLNAKAANNELNDSAKITIGKTQLAFTTDSYVVKPLFFNGGDIGKLSVCGTVNDLAVAGAKPVAISLALIIETGFEITLLEKILKSIGDTARKCNVEVVTGDTKTVETGSADGIFINTSGIGVAIEQANLGFDKIKTGDVILINGTIGDHGMTIMTQRKEIQLQSSMESDCAPLNGLINELLTDGNGVKFMRDPTRGGLAATVNEIAKSANIGVQLLETAIPIAPSVQAAADILGFDLLNVANEGKFIAVIDQNDAQRCLELCKKHPLGKNAAIIGSIEAKSEMPIVELVTKIGGKRIVQTPYGQQLPRIC